MAQSPLWVVCKASIKISDVSSSVLHRCTTIGEESLSVRTTLCCWPCSVQQSGNNNASKIALYGSTIRGHGASYRTDSPARFVLKRLLSVQMEPSRTWQMSMSCAAAYTFQIVISYSLLQQFGILLHTLHQNAVFRLYCYAHGHSSVAASW